MHLFAALVLLLLIGLAYSEDNATIDTGQDIQFVGTLLNLTEGNKPGAPDYWTINVDEMLLGSRPCNDTIKVIIYQSTPPPWGTADKDVLPGDKVWISGRYVPRESGCEVTLQGSDQYYLRRYPDEIKLVGTLSGFNNMAIPGGGPRWLVDIDKVLSGPKPCSNQLSITTFQAIYPSVWGKMDPDIKSGDKVEVFGAYHYHENNGVNVCAVTLYGSRSYYIKKQSSEGNSTD
ncbi:MAG: hypothetical protein ACE14P_13680 [Methanotrichaceae archaeon]